MINYLRKIRGTKSYATQEETGTVFFSQKIKIYIYIYIFLFNGFIWLYKLCSNMRQTVSTWYRAVIMFSLKSIVD